MLVIGIIRNGFLFGILVSLKVVSAMGQCCCV